MSLKISAAGKTDVGLVRETNEDAFLVITDSNLLVVCDGMGGHQAGEVASGEACNIINQCFTRLTDELLNNSELDIADDLPSGGDLLIRAIRLANRSIYRQSRADSRKSGMGTTVVGAVLEQNLISFAHAGDSRAYRLTDQALMPLTNDHSWVSQLQANGNMSEADAANLVSRNVITRALGVNERVEIDFRTNIAEEGDIYVFCSDGLCGFAEDEEIFAAAAACQGDVSAIVSDLVQLANDHGGQDNVTVVAVRIDSVGENAGRQAYGPVTIPFESDAALEEENRIIADIEASKKKVDDDIETVTASRKGNRWTLPVIFVCFIILAAIIIYLYR